MKGEGVCSGADCGFQFCTACLCAFHGSRECGSQSVGRRKKDILLPGSAQSKRNVKRLWVPVFLSAMPKALKHFFWVWQQGRWFVAGTRGQLLYISVCLCACLCTVFSPFFSTPFLIYVFNYECVSPAEQWILLLVYFSIHMDQMCRMFYGISEIFQLLPMFFQSPFKINLILFLHMSNSSHLCTNVSFLSPLFKWIYGFWCHLVVWPYLVFTATTMILLTFYYK